MQPLSLAGDEVDQPHAARPIDEGDGAFTWQPDLVRDPLHSVFTLVDAPIAAAVAADGPDAVGERASVEDEIVVVRAELRMADRVALEHDAGFARARIDQDEARDLAGLDRDRPPVAAGGQRGGAHRGADHALLAHLDRTEIGELGL